MMLDKQLMVASAQSITVTSAIASEDKIALEAIQMIGAGEPFGLFVSCTSAGTVAQTLTAEIVADDDGAGTNIVVLGKSEAVTITSSSATAPTQFVVAAKAPHTKKDYLYARFTVGGASSDAVLDAYIQPLNMIQTAGVD